MSLGNEHEKSMGEYVSGLKALSEKAQGMSDEMATPWARDAMGEVIDWLDEERRAAVEMMEAR